MITGVEISHIWGLTRSGRVGIGKSGVWTCEATRGRRWESGGIMGPERVAPKLLRIWWPSKSPGQTGMIRKEYKKNHPARTQGNGRVLGGKEAVLSTP